MKENKGVLITIIVLLTIFLPLTILGYINEKRIENNYENNFFHNGYLWFYDDKNELISKYKCESEECGFAKSKIYDEEYNIKYYDKGSNEDIGIINEKYAFLRDGEIIIFYDVPAGKTVTKYKNINNYNTKLNNNEYLLENLDGMWGVLSFYNDLQSIIPFEYEFIGLSDKTNEDNELVTDYYLVRSNGEYFVIDKRNKKVTNTYSQIYDYDIKPNNIVVVAENILDVYDMDGNVLKTLEITNDYDTLEVDIEGDLLKVKIDGVEKYNVEFINNIW